MPTTLVVAISIVCLLLLGLGSSPVVKAKLLEYFIKSTMHPNSVGPRVLKELTSHLWSSLSATKFEVIPGVTLTGTAALVLAVILLLFGLWVLLSGISGAVSWAWHILRRLSSSQTTTHRRNASDQENSATEVALEKALLRFSDLITPKFQEMNRVMREETKAALSEHRAEMANLINGLRADAEAVDQRLTTKIGQVEEDTNTLNRNLSATRDQLEQQVKGVKKAAEAVDQRLTAEIGRVKENANVLNTHLNAAKDQLVQHNVQIVQQKNQLVQWEGDIRHIDEMIQSLPKTFDAMKESLSAVDVCATNKLEQQEGNLQAMKDEMNSARDNIHAELRASVLKSEENLTYRQHKEFEALRGNLRQEFQSALVKFTKDTQHFVKTSGYELQNDITKRVQATEDAFKACNADILAIRQDLLQFESARERENIGPGLPALTQEAFEETAEPTVGRPSVAADAAQYTPKATETNQQVTTGQHVGAQVSADLTAKATDEASSLPEAHAGNINTQSWADMESDAPAEDVSVEPAPAEAAQAPPAPPPKSSQLERESPLAAPSTPSGLVTSSRATTQPLATGHVMSSEPAKAESFRFAGGAPSWPESSGAKVLSTAVGPGSTPPFEPTSAMLERAMSGEPKSSSPTVGPSGTPSAVPKASESAKSAGKMPAETLSASIWASSSDASGSGGVKVKGQGDSKQGPAPAEWPEEKSEPLTASKWAAPADLARRQQAQMAQTGARTPNEALERALENAKSQQRGRGGERGSRGRGGRGARRT